MLGHVVSSSLRLRALVIVIAALVVAVGVVSLRKMPVDVYPEILPVTVTVQTEGEEKAAEKGDSKEKARDEKE